MATMKVSATGGMTGFEGRLHTRLCYSVDRESVKRGQGGHGPLYG
jgi:hypothetical protein